MNDVTVAAANELRDAAYRVCRAVRVAEDVVVQGRRPTAADRATWADLRDASARLAALVADHDPGDIEAPPPGPSGGRPVGQFGRRPKQVIV
ncbi:hypothetical protein [Micromonospora chersina]|uniref:hypothetical protein n=1 Tax=Micromonospora chersina TaxID=47854 RepID=UPI00371770F2